MKSTLRAIFILAVSLVGTQCFSLQAAAPTSTSMDVSSRVISLGIPVDKPVYARNVWDMQLFNGRIYIGYGNSSNMQPSPNAGPIPVIYYDPATQQFINEFTVDDEQINVFKILNGKLYIPGHDARDNWDYGNFYVLDNNKWQKIRSIPNASHVFDLAYFQGNLYSANGTEKVNSGEVMVSKNTGTTWASQIPASGFSTVNGMVDTIFEFDNKLYAFGQLPWSLPGYCHMLVMDGTSSEVQPVTKDGLMPGAPDGYFYKMLRTSVIKGNLIYLGVWSCNSLQWFPNGLYVAPQVNQARQVILSADNNVLPTDILVRDNTVYILAYKRESPNLCTNIVYRSKDLQKWTEVFRFKYETFARSFEEYNGDFYFGMGCETNNLPASTGTILKVPQASYKLGICSY